MQGSRSFFLAPLFLFAFAAAASAQASVNNNSEHNPAATQLHQLFDRDWDYQMEHNPVRASLLGDRRWNDKWPDVRLESLREQFAHARDSLKQLHAIERVRLSGSDQISYDVFEYNLTDYIEGEQYRWYLVRTNTFSGIQTVEGLVNSLRFETVKDYEDWIGRMHNFPAYMDQNIALMREGMQQHIVLPKIIGEKILAQLAEMNWDEPTKHGFYKPFSKMPNGFSENDKKRLTEAGQAAIRADVLPAFKRFREFLKTDYVPASFEQVGAWQVPNGDTTYAYLARSMTTTTFTPEQIHQTGLVEVKRIRGEMEKTKEQAGFKGGMPEFFQFLRNDPKFYAKNENELLEYTRAEAKKIDPLLVKLFQTFPRLPYGVMPVPREIAMNMPSAYASGAAPDGSRPGFFYMNTYKPETRPEYEITSLILHEAVPGHTFQGGIAIELKDLPKFRRYGGYSAYQEGWALYCESLGDELGLYDDPYVKFGRLSNEMWRAVRLVVDTGMHYKHWTRKQAIEYFMENVATTEYNATSEVDRYISWPGQALAYKIGELKIKELRARAEKQLGASFNIREFHDALLLNSALPLTVLEKQVDAWTYSKMQAAAGAN
ncbi:MAG TPA: DUF885 domain-containing protein [Terriglobales bacterium]|jgi:uncharacterized protein (DUF885 family)|nr:DUF885 domain-containing protein [Terriglobales bacterium]